MSLREVIPTSFADVLNLFGISLQGNKDNTFVLRGEVTPVVLVGSTTEIQSISTPMTLDVPATGGDLAAPADLTILADTGPLADGVYAVYVTVGQTNAANSAGFRIQRRNAANAVTIWETLDAIKTADGGKYFQFVCRLNINERIRVQEWLAGSSTIRVNIWTERLGA